MSLEFATRVGQTNAWMGVPHSNDGGEPFWVSDRSGLEPISGEIEQLQLHSSVAARVTARADWRLAAMKSNAWAQRFILFRSGGLLQAVVYLRERLICGIATGYLQLDATHGETVVICKAGRENDFLGRAATWLFERNRCFLLLLKTGEADTALALNAKTGTALQVRRASSELRWSVPLLHDFDATIQDFGRRTRRNLRYALRRVEKNGWQFTPRLGLAERTMAIRELADRSTHPIDSKLFYRRMALLENEPELFVMGLADKQGHWLSCLVARRIGDRTEIFWQLNEAGHSSESICLSMRAMMMRAELEGGSRAVEYVSGTGPQMRLCCVPTAVEETSLSRPGLRRWLLATLVRLGVRSLGPTLERHL